MSQTIAAAIDANREELVAAMMKTGKANGATSEADTRQFVVGYVNILAEAARENVAPRDEYLAAVIPAIRDGGMPLEFVMDGMVRVATTAGAVLGAEHMKWLSDFQGDYTSRLLSIWGAK